MNTPEATAAARALISTKNGGGVTQISFSTSHLPMDTITVRAERTAPGFLSKVLGISSVDVGADSVVRVYNLGSAKYAAPFGVIRTEPMLNDCGGPCFGSGYPTTLAPPEGRPRLVQDPQHRRLAGRHRAQHPRRLDRRRTQRHRLNVGWYWGDPGAKFNSSEVKDAMDARIGSDILLPIDDQVQGQGSGFQYSVARLGRLPPHALASSRATAARSLATSSQLPGRVRRPKAPATTSGPRS